MPTPSSLGEGWLGSRPRRSWPTPGSGSSCSTRSPKLRWAGRPSGRSEGSSSSTRPNSGAWGSATPATSPSRTGLARRGSTAPRTSGPGDGPRRYVDFAAGEKRAWLRAMGHRIFPVVGWAERGGNLATEHGNSVPRFHITWGTGPGLLEPFERRVRAAVAAGTGDAALSPSGHGAQPQRWADERRARRAPRTQRRRARRGVVA